MTALGHSYLVPRPSYLVPHTSSLGRITIPFSFQLPPFFYTRHPIRLYVRTRTWPIGWGATFLFDSQDVELSR